MWSARPSMKPDGLTIQFDGLTMQFDGLTLQFDGLTRQFIEPCRQQNNGNIYSYNHHRLLPDTKSARYESIFNKNCLYIYKSSIFTSVKTDGDDLPHLSQK